MDTSKKTTPFHLREESSGFSSRSSDIFGNLDKLEKKHDQKQKEFDDKPESRKEQRSLWKEDPKEETISSKRSPFKMPYSRPPSFRGSKHRRLGNRTPDYKVNPERWTKYSLEDVQTNESSNTRAAFAFLEERRKLREAEELIKNPEKEGSDGKFVFKKPHKVSGGVNTFSSKKTKNSKADKVSINHLEAEDFIESKNKLQEDVVDNEINVLSSTSTASQSSVVSFKKGSRKRNIRVRDADNNDEEEIND